MLSLSDVTRTFILQSLTARELPLSVEGYMVYCNSFDDEFNRKIVSQYMPLIGESFHPYSTIKITSYLLESSSTYLSNY